MIEPKLKKSAEAIVKDIRRKAPKILEKSVQEDMAVISSGIGITPFLNAL
jgi:hypothetical protein